MTNTAGYMGADLPPYHHQTHENDGTDELNVDGLSGVLAEEQPSKWSTLSGQPSEYPPEAHASSHESGGADEMDLTGLTGGFSYTEISHPGGFDYNAASFTHDSAWHTLDISLKVPVGTKLVNILIAAKTTTIGKCIIFGKDGVAEPYVYQALFVQVSGYYSAAQMIIAVKSNRTITYQSNLTNITDLYCSILGYFS